jgi:hypothetical protein
LSLITWIHGKIKGRKDVKTLEENDADQLIHVNWKGMFQAAVFWVVTRVVFRLDTHVSEDLAASIFKVRRWYSIATLYGVTTHKTST